MLITAQGNIQEGEDAIFSGPAIGCYRIASFLRFFGLETDVFDPDLEDEASLFRKIEEKEYEIIGFSCLHTSIVAAMNLMGEVKLIAPHACLVAGGQGAVPNKDLLFRNSPVSVVVGGWGEFPMLEMAMAGVRQVIPQDTDFLAHKGHICEKKWAILFYRILAVLCGERFKECIAPF